MKRCIMFVLFFVTNLCYGDFITVKNTGEKIVKEKITAHSISRAEFKKNGVPKSHTIYVLYQGNSEVDIAEITYGGGGWGYKLYRNGTLIDSTDDGPMVYRDTNVVKGSSYTYQTKIYWGDSLISESNIITANPGIICGQISRNTIWKKKDNPFVIQGSLYWAQDCVVLTGGWGDTSSPTLTIEPGVEIKIDPSHVLGATAGNLVMLGKKDTMIKISSNTGTRSNYNVAIQDSCKGTLEWVEVTGAGFGVTSYVNAKGSANITRCRFTDDSIGINAKSPCKVCSVFIADCNYGIYSSGTGLPQIRYSEIINNKYGIMGTSGGWFNVGYSNICGNDSAGARNNDGAVNMSAMNCYWGSGGPKTASGKFALGDTIIGNINYTPYLNTYYDVELANIDLKIKDVKTIQTVQDVDLVTRKPTMVRVFVDAGRCKPVNGVNVKLTFNGTDYFSAGNSIKGAKVWTNAELNTGVNSINFFIPIGDLFAAAGNSVVNAEVDYAPGAVEERNETNNTGIDSVKVVSSPRAWITYRPISAERWHGLSTVNITDFAQQCHSFLEAILPMYWGMVEYDCNIINVDSTVTGGAFGWNTRTVMSTIIRLYASEDVDHRVVGIAPKGTFSHGLSHSGYARVVLIDSTTFPGDQWVATHEMGHVFNGRGYVLNDEYYEIRSFWDTDGNSSWPYKTQPDGSVSSEGWWVEKGTKGCIHNPHPKDYVGNNYYSFMGNSGTMSHWVSDSVYKILLNNFPAKKKASVPRIAFSFNIYDNDSALIKPSYKIPNGEADTGQPGNYRIECQNGSGSVLSGINFEPDFIDVPSSTLKGSPYYFNLEFPVNTQKIVIKHNSNIIKQVVKSANAPIVTLLYPNGGESFSDTVRVKWSGNDIDGGQLYYWLLYTKDSVWTPIAIDLIDTTYLVNMQSFPGGTTCKFKVIATDGINTSSDESNGDFGTDNKAPSISIAEPFDSVVYAINQEVAFSANSYDAEDRIVDDTTLKWTSNVSGQLGTGKNLSTMLSLGNHTIYLTGHDSKGLIGGDSIHLSVVSDTLPDVYITTNDISTNKPPVINDTCWIRTDIKNIRKDAECLVSVYLHHIDSANLITSALVSVEANKITHLNVMWTPLAVGLDTVWVKISEVDPVENDTTNNIASKVFTVVLTGAEETTLPKVMFLSQNYPNPALNSTFIKFGIPEAGNVKLKIYNVSGRLVKTLFEGECTAGYHTVKWNGTDAYNKKIAAGIYFVRLQNNKRTLTRKTVILQ
ncbi:MAG: T9SS type A sorting domain-containing protein [bacterium]|nr:T9SS type A sorting domain-containing protein [bacterium]